MTSLDKALIKVYEHGHAPEKRRPVEPTAEQPTRELYVDPPVDDVPSPVIGHQVTAEEMRELIGPEPEQEPQPEETHPETANFAMGEMTTSLNSFVVHQEFDIPVLDEISSIVADPVTEPVVEPVTVSAPERVAEPIVELKVEEERAERPFSPAWEVDSFELPDSTIRLTNELREQLDEFSAYLQQTTSDDRKLVTVHSQSRGEGRTTLSITFASALARTGARVLLVDSDFENPALANRLGLAVELGWEKAIAGEVPVDECSVRSIGDGFTILPLSEAAIGEDHTILRDALRNLLSDLVGEFDLILIDTGPGQTILGEIFDNIIATRVAVRDVRRTDSRLMLQFMTSLRTNAAQIVEAVDNFA